jgi:hypothetical protein
MAAAELVAVPDVRLESTNSSLSIQRPAPGIAVLVITGTDIGEHGDAPFLELAEAMGAGKLELFVDARESRAVALDVSGRWARWLGSRRASLERVNMLTGSRFVQLTAKFVRDFAELGELMRIYSDPSAFDAALAAAIRAARAR